MNSPGKIPIKFYFLLTMIASLISSLLIDLFSANYTASLIVNIILIISILGLYHTISSKQKGKNLVMSQLAAAGYIFLASASIFGPYIGYGKLVFLLLFVAVFVPYVFYLLKTMKEKFDREEE